MELKETDVKKYVLTPWVDKACKVTEMELNSLVWSVGWPVFFDWIYCPIL